MQAVFEGSSQEGEGEEMNTMMPLPERDRHAEALAHQIIEITRAAYKEIDEFRRQYDHRGAYYREERLREELVEACVEFNKVEARSRKWLEDSLAGMVVANKTFVLKPMPENE